MTARIAERQVEAVRQAVATADGHVSVLQVTWVTRGFNIPVFSASRCVRATAVRLTTGRKVGDLPGEPTMPDGVARPLVEVHGCILTERGTLEHPDARWFPVDNAIADELLTTMGLAKI